MLLVELRQRWRTVLIGTEYADQTNTFRLAAIHKLTESARSHLLSMDAENLQQLWPDLARCEEASDVRDIYLRLKEMAMAYATPGSEFYHNDELCLAILQGLKWAYTQRYNEHVSFYGNWWYWEIGAPLALLDTLILMFDELEVEALASYLRVITCCTPSPEWFFHTRRSEPKVSTGANRVWKCHVFLLASLLKGDTEGIRDARDALAPVFDIVHTGDGFYEDGSFIQHARHPYTGCYGKSLLKELADLLYFLDGGPWEVNREHIGTVYRWVKDSFKPLMYKGLVADMVSGRGISRHELQNHENGHTIVGAILRLAELSSIEGADGLKRMAKHWIVADTYKNYLMHAPLDLVSAASQLLNDASIQPEAEAPQCKVFAQMDRVIFRREDFAFGLSMHSSRISAYESINGENLRGWYMSHGMTYVYNSDQGHYSDGYWPTVDPYRLPGTTISKLPRHDGGVHTGPGVKSFVGGVVCRGLHGAAAMEIEEPGVYEARKSWFMIGDVIMALGSGISAEAGHKLETVIDNRMLNQANSNIVTVVKDCTRRELAASGEHSVVEPDWVHLEGNVQGSDIGYYFPRQMPVQLLRETRVGRWSSINRNGPDTELERSYLTLWLNHGIQPEQAEYAYVIMPGYSLEQLSAYAAGPKAEIVELSREAHAVKDDVLGLLGIHFWEDAPKKVETVTCSTRASMMLKEDEEMLELALSDPSQENKGTIDIEIETVAATVIEGHERFTVHRLQPTIRLSMHAAGAEGQTFTIRFIKTVVI